MKNFSANLDYFFKEAKRIIFLNKLSNIFTFLGAVLILLILATVVTGWSISSRLVWMLEEEAEISAFSMKIWMKMRYLPWPKTWTNWTEFGMSGWWTNRKPMKGWKRFCK